MVASSRTTTGTTTPGDRFRRLLAGSEPLLLPGSHDALSAKLVEQAGFEATYLSGSAVAMSLLGLPDIGLVTATEMSDQARRVVRAVSIPVVCDADTGYGNALNVRRTVADLTSAGVAGIQLEDQTFPKRCGHFEGKSVIGEREMSLRVAAAADARPPDGPVIIARTDARAELGVDAAIARAKAYQVAGAEVVFVEALQSEDELRAVAGAIDAPCVVNVVEGGKTPELPFDVYAAMGFRVVLYPTAGVRVVGESLSRFYAHLRDRRSSAAWAGGMLGFDERNRVTELARYLDLVPGEDPSSPDGSAG